METHHYSVIIVGAGIAGINAAYRLQSELPDHPYVILEARSAIGGTWDLFRYPGVRSDSDLFTFGFSWFPWDEFNPIADGESIAGYIRRAAAHYDIDRHVVFRHRVLSYHWSSTENLWTLLVDHQGQLVLYITRFIILGTGYYDYDKPLDSPIPGLDRFERQVVHPQFWPANLDYEGKRIVIIGSGATAVTLLPRLVEKAAKVTMLQRSPTYILPMVNKNTRTTVDALFPPRVAHRIKRARWIITSRLTVLFCQTFPRFTRWLFRLIVSNRIPPQIPCSPHFDPKYNPWEQRLCICPDGDFFASLHTGRADVETGTIREVVADGIILDSEKKLEADMIVTATGMRLQMAGGASFYVDDEKYPLPEKYTWNGVMLQDLPNMAMLTGYTNASWTLGVDAKMRLICRLLRSMADHQHSMAVPRVPGGSKLEEKQLLDLKSTYIVKGAEILPRAAKQRPWCPHDNYLSEWLFAKYGSLEEGLEVT
ncbi:flavin-containing monooxygenase [Aspergillus candidus]|uniref:Putative flavin-binding monooxygenase n=1 Tax=Aspergillus candidus TaxID=41067 RepID=A0A2I2F1N9_ASPCN|nr:putative flavin-binding monooxygenase [Aspergillus candidus]PLB34516.1 putative flavin-binding monooxygenase [Aspergillus candidus]